MSRSTEYDWTQRYLEHLIAGIDLYDIRDFVENCTDLYGDRSMEIAQEIFDDLDYVKFEIN